MRMLQSLTLILCLWLWFHSSLCRGVIMPEEAPKLDRVGRLNLEEVLHLSTFSPKGLDRVDKLERAPCLSIFSDKHYKNLPFLFYSWKIPTKYWNDTISMSNVIIREMFEGGDREDLMCQAVISFNIFIWWVRCIASWVKILQSDHPRPSMHISDH